MVTPITRWPCRTSSAAATELSTPPDIATRTVFFSIAPCWFTAAEWSNECVPRRPARVRRTHDGGRGRSAAAGALHPERHGEADPHRDRRAPHPRGAEEPVKMRGDRYRHKVFTAPRCPMPGPRLPSRHHVDNLRARGPLSTTTGARAHPCILGAHNAP